MTVAFDNNARLEMQQLDIFNEFEYNGEKVCNMSVVKKDVKFARPYIATFHYSKSMPDSTKFVYAGYYGDKLAGIVVYGMGAGSNQYKSAIKGIKKGQYVELTRLWSPDGMPKNTESKLISESLKLLPSEIKLILSFADENEGHVGTIYQATNWIYTGTSNGGKKLVNKHGISMHQRLIGIYKMRHPELKAYSNADIMKMNEWHYEVSHPKHRYIYLKGSKKEIKQMKAELNDSIMTYPKKV